MKNILLTAILAALLLSGCAARDPAPAETVPVTVPAVTQPEDLQKESRLLQAPETNGAVTAYRFHESVVGFLPLDSNLLFFSAGDQTSLILADPEDQQTVAVHETEMVLMPPNATVQLLDSGISYFNGAAGETVVLDKTLREIRRIKAPEDLVGMPLLSPDGHTLYYCTASAIRALDVDDRISRILKEAAYPVQGLSGILLDGTVLQISITDTDGSWRTLFVSTENGQLLQESEGNVLPHAAADSYLLQTNETVLFGRTGGSTMLLHPRFSEADSFFLPDTYSAVTASFAEKNTVLDCYDLTTGLRTASVSVPGIFSPVGLTQVDGAVWFLDLQEEPVLYRWDPADSPVQDNTIYTSFYYTREEPDYEGLAACSLYAQELSAKYGIDILVYKDAVATEPWDYHLDYEYQASILRQELDALDRRLSRFPEGFLQTLRNSFTALKICIVRHAEGSPESGSLEAVNGIQFLDGFDAYIVLATDHDTEYALYHELSHLMETVVLTESVAYDRWDNLNPSDFRYTNDYAANQDQDISSWMKPGKAYFIDTYSMSFAKEDRARLFEYAMTSGHEDLFTSVNLQAKLRQMCSGIREAFGLERSTEALPWEQYLSE